ncbi:hypothetical protein CY35_03G018800 [Sphagnum magellanicum]|nr:hypothetical protein CY35_03G018800 [Sphagnum magellanicum]
MDGADSPPSTDFSPGPGSVPRVQLHGNTATTGATASWMLGLGPSGTPPPLQVVQGTGEGRAGQVTNDGVMVVTTSTHVQASVASQSLSSQNVLCSSQPLGQLSVAIPSTLLTVSSQLSPTLPQHQQHQITSASSNPCHHALVRVSRQGQEGTGEGHIHPAVARTVVNLVPLQGAQSPVVGAQIAKARGSVRIQGSPQEKVLIPHLAQRPGMHRAPSRNSGWQATPPGPLVAAQTLHAGSPRVYSPLQHPLLSSQSKSSQGPQHLAAMSAAAVPQQQGREVIAAPVASGSKGLPMFPVMRTVVSGTPTPVHGDVGCREGVMANHIVVTVKDRKSGLRDCVIPLPKPLTVAEADKAEGQVLENGKKSDEDLPSPEVDKLPDSPTADELLQSHIHHFRNVRKRSREERTRRIARFKPRLALLLPSNNEAS